MPEKGLKKLAESRRSKGEPNAQANRGEVLGLFLGAFLTQLK